MKRSAFTLIELAMVMLLLAVAAAAVVLKVQRPLRTAEAKDAIGAITEYDATTRAAARLQDRPLQLMVSLGEGTLWRADETGRKLPSAPLQLGGGTRISRILLGGVDRREGKAAISCSSRGLTPTYALLIESSGTGQWVVVAGLSGQLVQVNNEDEARKIMAAPALGVTLVEAAVGTVLLGTLLVSIVTARVQITSQSRRSVQCAEACRIVDELMNDWWKDIATLPRNGEAPVKAHKGWRWRTRTQHREDADALHADVVSVEVFAPGSGEASPAAMIEVLLPPEEAPSDPTEQSTDAH